MPHVRADTEDRLFYAFGAAQARAHLPTVLRNYAHARGIAAACVGAGPSGETLESDRWVHRLGIPKRASRWYAAQLPQIRGHLDAFALGINAFADRHPDLHGPYGDVLPVRPWDALAHVQRIGHCRPLLLGHEGGSNAWALRPERSVDGHAMLLCNPHLPWTGSQTLFEAHLECPPESIWFYGAFLVGIPYPATGFNNTLGWCFTADAGYRVDYYALAARGNQYVLDGATRTFDTYSATIRERVGSGHREHTVGFRRSVHGPIIQDSPFPIAARIPGLERPHVFAQTWRMVQARTQAELHLASSGCQIPGLTCVYADADGNVGSVFGGMLPRHTLAPTTGPYPGDRSDALWMDYLPYGALPTVSNPESGWVQNTNDGPWTSTLPPTCSPADHPHYPAAPVAHLRAAASLRLLQSSPPVSLDDLVDLGLDTSVELGRRVLPDLARVLASGPPPVRAVSAALTRWDGRADPESTAVLFAVWWQFYSANGGIARIGPTVGRPLDTPLGVGTPALAVAAAQLAAQWLLRTHGRLDVPWGDVHRLRWHGVDVPAAGAPDALGSFHTITYGPSPRDPAKRVATSGDSFFCAVEFSDAPRARVRLATGNSSVPGSPHQTDQIELVGRQQTRPAWTAHDAIAANTASFIPLDSV